MKHGRVIHEGRVHFVNEGPEGRVLMPNGQLLHEAEVTWLPPFDFGTIFALGLNYAETYSCYKGGEKHCGKCGTCRERIEALHDAGIEDPTEYEE